jgi:5-dehydro-2-deoxygluconokinase
LICWPNEHTAKCLVFYHPDDPKEHSLEQEAQVRALYEATRVSGHELLLEMISPKERSQVDTVYRSLQRFYDLGIKPEWWKLESMTAAQWRFIDDVIAERDPYCRGVLLLGLSAPVEKLADGFEEAAGSTSCRGFAVGRTIFEKPSLAWLAGEIDDQTLVARTRETFETLIKLWRQSRGKTSAPAKTTTPILEEYAV